MWKTVFDQSLAWCHTLCQAEACDPVEDRPNVSAGHLCLGHGLSG